MEENKVLSLEEFLAENTVEGETTEVVLSQRLKDYKFKIGTMNKKEHEKYQKACLIRDKKGRVVEHKQYLFNELVIQEHCIYPNFKAIEFLQKLGVNTPSEAINKVLKIGEINELAGKILKFNGFDESFEEEVETAKN